MKTNLLFAAVALMVISACGKSRLPDHHQRLLSPTAAAVSHPPPLPAVELSPDVALP